MAREVEISTEYQLVVEIARRIEGYRQRSREQFQQDKRAPFFGEFRGAPARGRGHTRRDQSGRPPYSRPTPPRGTPVRPYFSAMPEGSYRPPPSQGSSSEYSGHQGSPSAYFNAMPESSYRPPAIQGPSGGYSGRQAQTSGQQAMAPRGYYECGDPGHIKRTYPKLRGKAVQQGHQPMVSAPAAPPPRDPAGDPIFEEQGKVPVAEPTPADFMTAPGFQEVMGPNPTISQAGRGAQTPTAQAPGHAAAVYQTPGALPADRA
ncbi:PREDICTED: proline-rich protein 2-like [Nicotiana attenuata]|uniref:proline-rich protein 2-like n=1 Tax=Nicotiana attenuata TaxID=49451 RepID=UPI000904F305|nr:PREDICTED: proline-rich protein 2-like [Nicotiana attenuata]